MNENKSFGFRFAKLIDNFYRTNTAFITFVITMVIVAILQVVAFLFFGVEVAGTNEISNWKPWLYMAISLPGATLSLIGYVLTVRIDKRFFIPTIVGQFITTISSFLGGMVWTGFVMLFIMGLGITRYIIINKHGSDYNLNFKLIRIWGIIIAIIFSIVGMILALVPSIYEVLWFNNSTSQTFDVLYRSFDVLTANLALFGSVLLITKNKEAFAIFTICNVTFIALFAASSLWLNAIQIFVYLVSNIFAMVAWHYKSKYQN